jgi:signal transduction histidine kinase
VILVGGAKRLHCYTDLHMAFLASLATQAASCMRNAQLSERLLVAERYAGYGRLRAELAHEVGKPLGSAQVMAQRLAERLPRPARDDAAALLALVKEARGVLAEIEQQRTTSDAVSPGVGASVAEAAERAVRIIEGSVGLHRVSVRIPEGLAWVQCPSTSLVRVLSNLLDNAVRATAPEEVVELAAEAQGAGVAIEVSDRGCGMPEEDLRRAFLPFFSTREDGAGRGLGLSITREIVSGNDGMIDLASDEGVGTRVRVWFPTVPERQKSAAGARGSGGIG